MNLAKSWMAPLAVALVMALSPSVGWSSRALGAAITGQITAAPMNGVIEISNHAYHIKPNSAAEKAMVNFYTGETVDVILDGPAGSSDSQVVAISVHAGS